MGSAKLSHQLTVALLACAAACASPRPQPERTPLPERDAALRSLPAEVAARLARIWRFQAEARCPHGTVQRTPPGFTMEPPPSSAGPFGAGECEAKLAASETVAIDLARLYAGCDACIASCQRRDASTAHECWARCDLATVGDYRQHVQTLAGLLARFDEGFADWRSVIEPRAGAPESAGELTRCVEPPR